MQNKMEDQQRSINGCKYGTGFFGGKFLPFHRGHLDCILRCASECEKLYVVLMHNSSEEREVLANYQGRFPKKHLSAHTRELALRAELAPFENIEVFSCDCLEADARAAREVVHQWFHECRDLVDFMGRFDVMYSNEPEFSRLFGDLFPGAEVVLLDESRARNPVSATQVRDMPFFEAYGCLPREYQKLVNAKVLFTGPESSGKSTLIRKLAAVLNTSYAEEMGKLACKRFGKTSPGPEMYPLFIHEQVAANSQAVSEANMVALCDTDAIVTELYWRMLEGGGTMPLAREVARESGWDLVFFVEPTVPWVADGIRVCERQEARERQSRMLRGMYRELGYELITLNGDYRENYERALFEIEGLIGKQSCIEERDTANE